MKMLTLLYLLILNGIVLVDSYKILMVFNFFARSHYFTGKCLAKSLTKIGHEVTMVSVFKDENNVEGYKEVVLDGLVEKLGLNHSFDAMMAGATPLNTIVGVSYINNLVTEKTLEHKEFQTMLKSNKTFDLIIQEDLYNDALKGLSWYYNAPIILFSVFSSTNHLLPVSGSSAPSSCIPNLWSSFTYQMTFLQRSINFFFNMIESLIINYNMYVTHQHLLDQYFPGAPNIDSLNKNVALIFINNHESVVPAIPQVPNMVNILGFHLKNTNKLSSELQEFMDGAQHGVVFFSFGTVINISEMGNNSKMAFLKAFGKLKQKVIWKSDQEFEGTPGNILTRKWLPQEDILAHPNCKLFITHGGMNSMIETIYHAVPVLAIPFLGDQHSNAARIVDLNIGLKTSFKDLNEEVLDSLLEELLNNKKYQQNVTRRSNLLRDRPIPPMDLVRYWVDYVIRHKDLSHMRLSGLDFAWYQYFCVDVILVWSACFIAMIIFLRRFVNILISKSFNKVKVKTQ